MATPASATPVATQGFPPGAPRLTSTWSAWWIWELPGFAWLALVAVVIVDVTDLAVGFEGAWTGRVPQASSLWVGLAALAALGPRRLGLTRSSLWAWREMFAIMALGIPATGWVYAVQVDGSVAEVTGLVLASSMEELSYRVAAPLVFGAIITAIVSSVRTCTLTRPPPSTATWSPPVWIASLAFAAVFFAVLPGHVSQMTGPAHILPFVGIALYFSYVVHRTGAIWPVMAVHATMNLLTFSLEYGELPRVWHAVGVAGALLLLAVATEAAGRRLGLVTSTTPPVHPVVPARLVDA